MPGSGFLNQHLLTVKKEPFGDWATQLEKANAGLKERIDASVGVVLASMEDEIRSEVLNHPDWPNDIADKVKVHAPDGEVEVLVDDHRAEGLEYGNDPEEAGAPLLGPYAARSEAEVGKKISDAVQKATRL